MLLLQAPLAGHKQPLELGWKLVSPLQSEKEVMCSAGSSEHIRDCILYRFQEPTLCRAHFCFNCHRF